LQQVFSEVRRRKLNKSTVAPLIKLRRIIYALQDIGERIKRLRRYTHYDKKISRQYVPGRNAGEVNRPVEISPALLLQNFSLRSGQFRHAIRITLAMLAGYVLSLLFPVGHSYWILLTIATILKPAYSISRTRNQQRLLGTLTGVIVSFAFLYFVSNNTLALMVMIIAMIVSYSLLTVNYYLSTACITIYVLISIHFLNRSDFTAVVQDRAIDTSIGCIIAFLAALFILPVWEHEQTPALIEAALHENKTYFNAAASFFLQKTIGEREYHPARKNAFVALANLNDNFQKMLSEPRRKQENMSYYHQFVASSYMLTVHIAALSALASRTKNNFEANDFEPLVNNINDKFKRAIHLVKERVDKPLASSRAAPITGKVQVLLQQRQKEIESGLGDVASEARITLRELKSVTDEFEIIDSIVSDEIKILKKVVGREL